jgi:hypothetical protein
MKKFLGILASAALTVNLALPVLVVMPIDVHAALTSNGTYDDFYYNGDIVSKILVDGDTTYIAGPGALGKTLSGYGLSLDQSDADSIGLTNQIAVTGGQIDVAVPDGSGGVYIGGNFNSVGGTTRNKIAHIEPDGTLNSSWNPNVQGGDVHAIAIYGSTIYLGGSFNEVDGEARSYLASVNNTDGSVTAWDPDMADEVTDIIIDSANDKVYVSGYWDPATSGADNGCPGMICALDPTTANDATLTNISANDGVFDLELVGSDLYLVGMFETVAGSGRNRIAKIDTDTDTLDAWNPGANGEVNEIEIDGTDVYVAGEFTTIGTDFAARPYVGALNSTTGASTTWNPQADAEITHMALNSDGSEVFISGPTFTALSNATATVDHGMAVVSTQSDNGGSTTWSPSFNSGVLIGVAEYLDSDNIYLGRASGGSALAAYNYVITTGLGAVNTSTNKVIDWNPNVGTGGIIDFILDDTYVYIAGTFDTADGEAIPALARYRLISAGGALDSDWDPGFTTAGAVRSLVIDDSILYAGGLFSTVDGQTRNNVAAFDLLTAELNSWDPNANSIVFSLTLGDDVIFVHGSFTTIAGESRRYLAGIRTSDATATDLSIAFDIGVASTLQQVVYDPLNNRIYYSANDALGDNNYFSYYDLTTDEVASSYNLSLDGELYDIDLVGGTAFLAGDSEPFFQMVNVNDATDISTGGITPPDYLVQTLVDSETGTLYAVSADTSFVEDYTLPTVQFDATTSASDEGAANVSAPQVNLSSAQDDDVSFTITTSGTATSESDYSYTGGSTPSITSGNTSTTLSSLAIINDILDESTETVILTISNVVFALLDTNSTHTHTITDNDTVGGGGGGGSGGGAGGSGDSGDSSSSGDQGADEGDDEPAEESTDEPGEDSEEKTDEESENESEEEKNQDNQEQDNNDEDLRGSAEETNDDSNDSEDPIEVPATISDVEDENDEEEEPVEVETPVEPEDPVAPTETDDPVVIIDDKFPTSDEILEDFINGQIGDEDQGEDETEIDPENLDEEEEHELKCELKDKVLQLRADIASSRDAYRSGRDNIISSRASEYTLLRDDYRSKIAEIRDLSRSKIDSQRTYYKASVDGFRSAYIEAAQYLRETYANEIKALRSNRASSEEISDIRAERTMKLKSARSQLKGEIADVKATFKKGVAEIKADQVISIANAKTIYTENREAVTIAYADKLSAYKDEYLARVASYKEQIASLNSSIRSLYGGSCEVFNEDAEFDGGDDDGEDDSIEDAIGTDKNDSDTDDDGIDDIDEAFLTFTDPNSQDGDETTAGVTGQSSSSGSKTVKAQGSVLISGINPDKSSLSCIVEKSPSSTSSVSQYSCDEKYVEDERGIYMLQFEPRDGDGEYTIRISDSNGVVERFNIDVDSGYRIGMPDLYDFEGYRSDSFNYVTDNQIVIKPKVGSFPTSIVDPTGCVAFGQCIVQARWNSLIFSSVILADSSAGRAVITPPKELEPGDHRVLLTTVDTETNEVSETLEVNFVVDPEIEDVEPKNLMIEISAIQVGLLTLLVLILVYMLKKEFRGKIKS